MTGSRLHNQLFALERKLHEQRFWRKLKYLWIAVAALELLLLLIAALFGWSTMTAWWTVLGCGCVGAWFIRRQQRRNEPPLPWSAQLRNYNPGSGLLNASPAPDYKYEVVEILIREHPEIRHLLAAAAEQKPDPQTGEFGFLQLRVIEEAVNHPVTQKWREKMARKVTAARNAHILAFAAMLGIFYYGHNYTGHHWQHQSAQRRVASVRAFFNKNIEVLPGDTELERGSGLVISARFGRLPSEASLVVVSASGKTQRLPMTRTLADPVFGASLMDVAESAVYRIEYAGKKTRDFKIHVFEYPALNRADADLIFPAYTGLTNRTIRDTLRISAVEGTRLTYTFQLNKPVPTARLVGKERTVTLTVGSNAVAVLNAGILTNSARYSLQLTDSDGRTNKTPAEFVIQVLPNKAPELKIVFPRGDQRVSPLEELQLQAETRDDFGLLKYGIGFGVTGKEPQYIELGQTAPASEKRQFNTQIALEKLNLVEDQLVSYFAWAEDYGPDGEPRRTFSDIFFAEVRPWEEIFRPDQSGASESQNREQNQNQAGGQGGNNNARLAELQKQIVIATWKLQQAKAVPQKGGK